MTIGLRDGDRAILRDTAIFSGIPDEALEGLFANAIVHSYERGETIFLQGDPAEAFFVLFEGWVKVYRLTPAGEEAIVHVFTRGQSFAEAAAFTGGHYPVSAEPVTDCRLAVIPVRRLFDQIIERPEIALAMLASTSQHLHVLVQQIEQLKAHTGAQRVAEFLIEMAPQNSGPCTLMLPYDKALIAGRLGMKPESLSRAFQRLKEYGVKVHQNLASIADVGKLRDFVEEERATVLQRHSGPARG
ncbi:MAG: cyclic nucleotide-binding protein [Hyphomicrobiales bacterium]|nr:MAG: cyclic nucleotide-binding protein [Hyphomicrobiales bacterium]